MVFFFFSKCLFGMHGTVCLWSSPVISMVSFAAVGSGFRPDHGQHLYEVYTLQKNYTKWSMKKDLCGFVSKIGK